MILDPRGGVVVLILEAVGPNLRVMVFVHCVVCYRLLNTFEYEG